MPVAAKTKGVEFRGLARYLERSKRQVGAAGQDAQAVPSSRVAWKEARNLPTTDAELAAQIMRATANHNVSVRKRTAKPVYHLSISFAPEDRPTQDRMIEVADRTITELGLQAHQILMVAHNDTPHAHVHLMVNRVSPTTFKVWSDSHDYARLEKTMRGIEHDMGLRIVPGHNFREADRDQLPPTRNPSHGAFRQMERTGERPFSDRLRAFATDEFRHATGWADLNQRLDVLGLRLERKGAGLVVTDGREYAKPSSIDRTAGLGALEKRFGSYDEYRKRPIDTPTHSVPSHRTGNNAHRGRESRRPDLRGSSSTSGSLERDSAGDRRDGEGRGEDAKRYWDDQARKPDGDTRPGPNGRGGRQPDNRHVVNDVGGMASTQSGPNRVSTPAPVPSLTEALAKLERFDRDTAALNHAEQEASDIAKGIKRLDGRAAWAGKLRETVLGRLKAIYRDPQKAMERIDLALKNEGLAKATGTLVQDKTRVAELERQAIETLSKVYRNPLGTYDRLSAEIEKSGIGRATAHMERRPEDFGRMCGTSVGPISNGERKEAVRGMAPAAAAVRKAAFSRQPSSPETYGRLRGHAFGPFKTAERREALQALSQAAREIRRYAGASRAVTAETASHQELRPQTERVRRRIDALRDKLGNQKRWELVRGVECAARRAAPQELSRLDPDQRHRLEQIVEDRKRFFAERASKQPKSQGPTTKPNTSKRPPRSRRTAPTPER